MIRIKPEAASVRPDGPPPVFLIETDDHPFYAVQVATDSYLFNGAAASRRSRKNFFDSWVGQPPSAGATGNPPVAAQHLKTESGKASYTLAQAVWDALRTELLKNRKLYYRVIVSDTENRKKTFTSSGDTDWKKAPALSVASIPASPTSAPYASFKGKDVLKRTDLLAEAKKQLASTNVVGGRDGDFQFVVLDANQFDITLIECHEFGLTDTVAKMPDKPDAAINGQMVGGTSGVGINMEGQDVREGVLINANSQKARSYISQNWNAASVADIHVGVGNPKTEQPTDRFGVGGLGPLLLAGAPPAKLSAWAKSLYEKALAVGRGAIAIDRMRGLILLIVQEDRTGLFSSVSNAKSMQDLRAWLKSIGCTDALFNDGSDSESLFANGGWMVKPRFFKDEAMDFAVGFVRRERVRRINLLAIDGTTSEDGRAFLKGLQHVAVTHYRPDNIGEALASDPAISSIADTFRSGLIEAGRAGTQAKAEVISTIFRNGGQSGRWADVLYLSSHASRHGSLFYHKGGGDKGPVLTIANPWASGFRINWKSTPKWVVIAGCAVLGLHYSRLLPLSNSERATLQNLYHDIHGSSAAVPGLDATKNAVFAVFHPGWGWYQRHFSGSGLRGVLGYWYRSPGGKAGDVGIIEEFAAALRTGATLLEAWKSANQRGILLDAAWAAMIREGCEGDTLSTLEQRALPAATKAFLYYDRYQQAKKLVDAYKFANRRAAVVPVGGASINSSGPDTYDQFALGKDLDVLGVKPTPASLLIYDDGVHP